MNRAAGVARPATVDVLPGVHEAGLGLPGETGLDRYRLGPRSPRSSGGSPLPVIARGAGLGLDPADVREPAAAGVAAIDVAGAEVPAWGVPTADALAEAVLVAPGLPVLAEAASGLDAAKCRALGAAAVTVASGEVEPLVQALRVATWSTGALGPADLTPGHLRLAAPPHA